MHLRQNVMGRFVLLVIVFVTHSATSESTYEACRTTDIRTAGAGDVGFIVSPTSRSRTTCKLMLNTCQECKLDISITALNFAPCQQKFGQFQTGCTLGCDDYIVLHEPYYQDTAFQYIHNGSFGQTYKSITSKIYMDICLSKGTFKLQYTVSGQEEYYSGDNGESMSLTSPRFPLGYFATGDHYRYVIENKDPNSRISLWFTDWYLYNGSSVKVYDTTEKSYPLTQKMGSEYRPYTLSVNSRLIIVFDTGSEAQKSLYLGFRAEFNFTRMLMWNDIPSGCGAYYALAWGGDFGLDTSKCAAGKTIDCFWVVNKYRIGPTYNEFLWLQIYDVLLDPSEGDILEIRSGNNSQGSSLSTDAHLVSPSDQFYERDAFYIHLRTKCQSDRIFKAVFASYDNAIEDTATNSYHCVSRHHSMCKNHRCIISWLRCDTKNHCGDWSDETECHDGGDVSRCHTHYPCDDGDGFYCSSTKCDNNNDCKDGTDEKSCWYSGSTTKSPRYYDGGSGHYYWGTITPVVLICLIFAIIACVVISYYVRRKRLLRERRQAAEQARGQALPPPPVPTVDGMLPPPYEEVMSATYVHSQGSINFAYDNSSRDYPILPPPYSPKYENPAVVPDYSTNPRPTSSAGTDHTSTQTPAHGGPPRAPLRDLTVDNTTQHPVERPIGHRGHREPQAHIQRPPGPQVQTRNIPSQNPINRPNVPPRANLPSSSDNNPVDQLTASTLANDNTLVGHAALVNMPAHRPVTRSTRESTPSTDSSVVTLESGSRRSSDAGSRPGSPNKSPTSRRPVPSPRHRTSNLSAAAEQPPVVGVEELYHLPAPGVTIEEVEDVFV